MSGVREPGPARAQPRARWLVGLAVAVVVTSAAAGWLLSSRNEFTDELGLTHNAPAAWERPVGVAAGLVTLLGLTLLHAWLGRRRATPWLFGVVVPLCAAWLIGVCGVRTAMGDVVGSDIGGGIFLLIGVPAIVVLLALAGARAFRLSQRANAAQQGSMSGP